MFPVLNNFKNGTPDENNYCRLCKSELEDQPHLMQCEILKSSIPELQDNKTIKYEHIFGNIKEKVAATKLLFKISKEHEKLLYVMSITN